MKLCQASRKNLMLCRRPATHIFRRQRRAKSGGKEWDKKYCCTECLVNLKRYVREPIRFEVLHEE